MNQPRLRISSIEVFRVIAVFAVICLHTRPFYELSVHEGGIYNFLFLVVDIFSRFAVPFFFMVSGYFFVSSYLRGKPLINLWAEYTKRILILLSFWSVIYAVLPDDFMWVSLRYGPVTGLWEGGRQQWVETVQFFQKEPITFMLESSAIHLWYLISLLMGLTLLACFMKWRKLSYGLALGVGLFLLALLMKPYSQSILGIQIPGIANGKDGPFFCTFFIMLGAWLASHKKTLSFWAASTLATAGFLISLAEVLTLNRLFKSELIQDFVAGTAPFAAGIFFIALAKPNWGAGSWISHLGRNTLGIYLSHIVAWELVWNCSKYVPSILWQFLFPVMVFIAALGITMVLKKMPGFARVVS